jgi:ankyrin repeat protein
MLTHSVTKRTACLARSGVFPRVLRCVVISSLLTSLATNYLSHPLKRFICPHLYTPIVTAQQQLPGKLRILLSLERLLLHQISIRYRSAHQLSTETLQTSAAIKMDDRLNSFLSKAGESNGSNNNNTSNGPALPPNSNSVSVSNKQRTIQVKIGNQAAKSMTPDQAAEYLQQLAGRGAFSGGREVKMTFGKGGSGGGEIASAISSSSSGSAAGPRMTFGPKRPPTSSASASASSSDKMKHIISGTMGGSGSMGANVGGIPISGIIGGGGTNHGGHSNDKQNNNTSPLSSLELAALAGDFGGIPTVGGTGGPGSAGNRSRRKDGMPCSEKEMKALMSMFVEIMGLQMNTEKLNKPKIANLSKVPENLFHFPADLPPPPGGWPEDLLWPDYQAEISDEDSIPDLEDITDRMTLHKANKKKKAAKAANESKQDGGATKSASTGAVPRQSVTGGLGIAAFEWEALERVAIEDALEQEERARKAAKKRDRKIRKKEKVRKEAEAKASEEKLKKREKQVTAWRSRVVSACHSNEVSKLKGVLSESPLRDDDDFTSLVEPHLQFLLPNCFAKNRSLVEKGKEARAALLGYILYRSVPIVFEPLRNGRSAFHTACFYGDISTVKQIVDEAKPCGGAAVTILNSLCQDSGWSPLHYAVLSGSLQVMENLLANGGDPKTLTKDTYTWRTHNGKGLTARNLIESIVSGNYKKDIETHGMALSEATHQLFSNSSEGRRCLALLNGMLGRLKDVETNGYSPLDDAQIAEEEKIAERSLLKQESMESEDTTTNKKGKKKKKGSSVTGSINSAKAKAAPAPAPLPAVAVARATTEAKLKPKPKEDPLVSALLGMGFTEEQIRAGIDACGGINRATADDVVMQIFQQQSGSSEAGGQANDTSNAEETTDERKPEATKSNKESRARDAKAAKGKKQEAAKREEEARVAAERLAAKREDQRRRNREWNNREQARQTGVSQGKVSKVEAALPVTGLAPASNFLSSTPLATGTHIYSTAVKSAQTTSVPTLAQNVSRIIDDTSTVASSVDHGSVEFGGNDDATVSTMGSFQTRLTPLSEQPLAPPGFGPSATIPEVATMEEQQRWSYQPPFGDTRRSAPSHGGPSMVSPLGIPESRPLLDSRLHGASLTGGHLGGMQSRMTAAQTSFPGGNNYGAAPTGMNTSSFFGGSAPPPVQSGFNGMYVHGGQSPVPPSVGSSVSAPTIPGPMGFGLDPQRSGSQTLDSSIIDSISTGGADLGGASLWGGTSGGAVGGSSLLGNLIHTNSLREEQQAANREPGFLNNNGNPSNGGDRRAPGGPNGMWGQGNLQGSGGGSIW